MRHYPSRVFAVNRIGFLAIVAHAHYALAFLGDVWHGVPDKFAAGGPSKVTHIVGFVNPGFGAVWLGFFVFLGFIQGYDFQRLFDTFGLFPTLQLSRR